MAVEDSDKPPPDPTPDDDSPSKEPTLSTLDDLSKSSKTDDEKLEEIASKTTEKPDNNNSQQQSIDSPKDVNVSKSDDEKLSESKKCDDPGGDLPSDEMSLDKWLEARRRDEANNSDADSDSATRRSARIKHISEIKLEIEDAENLLDVSESEALSSIELRDSLCRVSSPEEDKVGCRAIFVWSCLVVC